MIQIFTTRAQESVFSSSLPPRYQLVRVEVVAKRWRDQHFPLVEGAAVVVVVVVEEEEVLAIVSAAIHDDIPHYEFPENSFVVQLQFSPASADFALDDDNVAEVVMRAVVLVHALWVLMTMTAAGGGKFAAVVVDHLFVRRCFHEEERRYCQVTPHFG